jgi:hypothetical protein
VSEQLRPDDRWQAEIERRLRVLETAPRVGLSGLRSAWQTAAASPSSFGAFEAGPVAATWTDDQGNTGTGYPTLTVTTGTRYLLLWSARPSGLATAAAYRSASVEISVQIDGVSVPALPNALRTVQQLAATEFNAPASAIVARTAVPGAHTFGLVARWANSQPAGLTLPTLTEVHLAVLPIST